MASLLRQTHSCDQLLGGRFSTTLVPDVAQTMSLGELTLTRDITTANALLARFVIRIFQGASPMAKRIALGESRQHVADVVAIILKGRLTPFLGVGVSL